MDTQFVPTKKEIFGKRTAKEIQEGKMPLNLLRPDFGAIPLEQVVDYLHSEQIVDAIDGLASYQVLAINPLVPAEFENGNRLRHLKRGERVWISNLSAWELSKRQLTGKKLARDRFNSLDQRMLHTHFAFKDPIGLGISTGTLDQSIKGDMLYAYAMQNLQTSIDVEYGYHRNEFDVRRVGATYVVSVPAMDSKGEKTVRETMVIDGIPRVRAVKGRWKQGDRVYALAFSIHADHSCGVTKYAFSKREVKKSEICAHVKAGLNSIMDYEMRHHNNTFATLCPIPIATQKTVDFYKRLANNVYVLYRNSQGKTKERPLNWAEREILLWEFVKANGFRKTLDTSSNPVVGNDKLKLRDYNLDPRSYGVRQEAA